jgi:hypothetical protein
MSRTIVLVAGMMLSALALSAQQPAMPSGLDGQQIRAHVTTSIGGGPAIPTVIEGTVVRQTTDSVLIFDARGAARSVAVGSLTAIDVSQGKDRKRGAAVGALVGLALGLVATAFPADCDEEGRGYDCRADGSRPSRAQYAATKIFGGAMVGAAAGALFARPRWVRFQIAYGR